MPLSIRKQSELAVRRQIETHLFGLGLNLQDIATAMEVDVNSVRNDYWRMGGKRHFRLPEIWTTKHRHKTYGNALRMYATLDKMDLRKEVFKGLRRALAGYLDIESLKYIADGIAGMTRAMMVPTDPPEYRPYRDFLQFIFGFRDPDLGGADIFSSYLEHILAPDAYLPNRDDIQNAMGIWAVAEYSADFSLPLGATVVETTNQALKTLTPSEEKILRMRFGLGYPKMSLDEVTVKLGKTNRETIRRLETKALRKIRHPSRSGILRTFVESPFARC